MGNATSADQRRLRDALRPGRCSEIYKQTIMPAKSGSCSKPTLAKAFLWAFLTTVIAVPISANVTETKDERAEMLQTLFSDNRKGVGEKIGDSGRVKGV